MIEGEEIKQHVRLHYAGRVLQGNTCCTELSCGAPKESARLPEPLDAEPAEFAGPSLGCGSPLAFAHLSQGETVVDLGSGAGREVLQAAGQVGGAGKSIGIDMTPEMVWKARTNAGRAGISNAEFRLGEIEHLPLADASADVLISNCVINLVPDKGRAFHEAYRVLRAGGRFVVSDMVSNGRVPEEIRADAHAWAGCIAGAVDLKDYIAMLEDAGFRDVVVLEAGSAPPGHVYSVTVRARKPAS